MDIKADDICANCYREFADHNYLKDSIDLYECPVPGVDTGYGGFKGGDPRLFHPDHEMCSAKELENHKAACELWDEAELRGKIPEPEECPSGWIYNDEGERIAHVLRSQYGIGVYQIQYQQFWSPLEQDDQRSSIDDDLIF